MNPVDILKDVAEQWLFAPNGNHGRFRGDMTAHQQRVLYDFLKCEREELRLSFWPHYKEKLGPIETLAFYHEFDINFTSLYEVTHLMIVEELERRYLVSQL